ncbi:hypothetical protein AgCh_008877 [Apium graveolens]
MDPRSNSRVRIYQVWKGHNKFFCGGRLIFVPDASSIALTASLVGMPAIVFCTKMFLNLRKTSPEYGYSVLIVGIVLLVLTTYENIRYRYDKTSNPYDRGIVNNLKETIFAMIPPSLINFRVVLEDESLCTDSDISKEKTDVETEGVLGKYHSNNVYPTSKSVNIPEVHNTKGKEEASRRFEIGPISSPLFSEPRLRKWNSFNGETSIDNAWREDILFHRISSSYH